MARLFVKKGFGLRFLLCGLILFFVSCTSFKTARYRSPGETLPSPEKPNYPQGPFVLQWPVSKPVLSRGFKPRSDRNHMGLDLRGRKGQAIFAAHDGYVVYVGSGFRGYGKMILLEYNKTWATLYAHLSSFQVREGQRVVRGQTIGLMGRTGRATGVHLHFELLKSKIPVDPMKYLKGTRLAQKASH